MDILFQASRMKTKKVAAIIMCALAVLSAFQFCLAQTQAISINIKYDGQIDQVTPTIYAKIDFSTGDLSQINQLGGITADPPISTCQIQSAITRVGNYAMVSNQSDPGVLPGTSNRAKAVLSELGNLHLTEAYYGLSVYLPTTLNAQKWVQIFEESQFDPRNGTWPHIAQLQLCTINGTLRLNVLKGQIAPYDSLWTSAYPIPLGQWIDFVIYVKLAENGEVKVWQNDNLVADVLYATAISGLQPAAWPEFGLYQDHTNPPGNSVIDGRFVAANTYALASAIS
jgi:hypothetical protein